MTELDWSLRRTRAGAVAFSADLQWDGTLLPSTARRPDSVHDGLLQDVISAAVGWEQDPDTVINSVAATVPGTVAGALRDAGLDPLDAGESGGQSLVHPDDFDWWWSTSVQFPDGPSHQGGSVARTWRLRLCGVATVSEVFWDGQRVAHSVSGLDDVVVDLAGTVGTHELAVVCRAPSLVPVPRKPRPRWRSTLVADSSLRWRRTPLIGRIPWSGTHPVVGPWGEATLEPVVGHGVEVQGVRTALDRPGGTATADATGRVEVSVRVPQQVTVRATCAAPGQQATVVTEEWALEAGERTLVLAVADPALWWPATHGQPQLHQLTVSVRGPGEEPWHTIQQCQVGFRHITAEQHDGGFALVVNGRKIFARGAVWTPVDPVTLGGDPAEIDRMVRAMRAAGANLLRISGTHAWEQQAFYDACDQHGVMVWHDAMLATLDPPSEPEWLALVEAELRTWLPRLAAHACVAVFSGGNEVLQQPVLWGRDLATIQIPVIEDLIPRLCAELAPQVVHVPSSPSGGTPPTRPDTGISHWFGVGAYRRPLTDTRTSGVRFAAEALAFGVPPAASQIAAAFGSATADHNDDARTTWRAGAAKDPGASWDFEDTTVHYARRWLEPGLEADTGAAGGAPSNPEEPSQGATGLVPTDLVSRGSAPAGSFWAQLSREQQLQAERVAAARAVEHTLTDLRREASGCDGVVILSSRDLTAGPGWGLLDHTGRPKATWYAMRRACADTAVRIVDDGLSGLHIHVLHDRDEPFTGMMEVRTWSRHAVAGPSARVQVEMPGAGEKIWNVEQVLGGFLDLNHTWGFGLRQWEAVAVEIIPDGIGDPGGNCAVRCLRETRLLGDGHRDAAADLLEGLSLSQLDGGHTDGFREVGRESSLSAAGVSVDVGPGVVAEDDVMTLGPGEKREIAVVLAKNWPQTPAETQERQI